MESVLMRNAAPARTGVERLDLGLLLGVLALRLLSRRWEAVEDGVDLVGREDNRATVRPVGGARWLSTSVAEKGPGFEHAHIWAAGDAKGVYW